VRQLESGEARLSNAYPQVVTSQGNRQAQALIEAVFEPADRPWRGLGVLPQGGLALRPAYRYLDAAALEPAVAAGDDSASSPCISGRILRGLALPPECPAFGGACTPQRPLGAPMVSSEGACAAYHRYRR
jgi:hydrogenase expression/formation protein HypD